jgi:hypothetical protein
VIATVQLADLGTTGTIRTLLRRPTTDQVRGLRWAEVAVLAPLATTRPPRLRRAGLLAFWDDEHAADDFAESHPIGRRFAGGFRATLGPLRAFGAWPGLPSDLPDARAVPHDGPVVVVTLGRLRLSQAVRFVRASRPAERAAVGAEGMLWGTAAARPPFVATVSVWESSQASAAYAFGPGRPHSNAIAAQRRKDFHRQSAFVRFAPLRIEGALAGPNPLSAAVIPEGPPLR